MKLKQFFILMLMLAVIPLLQAQSDKAPIRKPLSSVPRRNIPNTATNKFGGPPPLPGMVTSPATGARPGAIPGTPATYTTATDPGTNSTTTAAGTEATYKYNFPAMPVQQVLDEYGKLIGKTLFIAGNGPAAVPQATTITLNTYAPLTKSEAIMALETVLGMNGITIAHINDKFAKVVMEGVAGQAGARPSTNDSNHLPDSGSFITQIVQLKYAKPEELTQVLALFSKMPNSIIVVPSTSTLILRDYAENVKRMLEMVERIDIAVPNEIKHEVIPIKYALASDISSALSSLGGGTAISVGKSTSGASFSRSGGSGNGSGLAGSTAGQGGFGSSSGSINPGQPTQSSNPLNSAATGGRSSFQNKLQGIVNKASSGGGGAGDIQLFGVTKIIADERTNSLLVFATEEDMKMIKDIIDKLDVVLAQVLIEAVILEVSLTDSKDLGVSYLQNKHVYSPTGNIVGGGGLNNLSSAASGFLSGSSSTSVSSDGTTNASSIPNGFPGSTLTGLPGGFSYFTSVNKDLSVVVTAVAGNGRVNVLSRPRIQTSHAVPADLFIGQTVPYVTGTYFNGGLGGGPSSQYQEREVGIRLQVLPLINQDGLVVMDIQQDIEQLGAPVAIPGAGNVPTTTKRQAGAKVAVRDGDTIILGGFISASRSKSHSGVPFLKDIPGLGALFRSSSESNERTELIVLMRPTVLKTPEIAAIVAEKERAKMSGVKQAERDLREDERKRNESIEKELQHDAEKQKKEDEKKARDEEKRMEKQEKKDEKKAGKTGAPISVTIEAEPQSQPMPLTPDQTVKEQEHLKAILANPQQ